MTIEQVKSNLNKVVLFSDPQLHMKNQKYTLVGCTIRRDERGFYYQAEIQDIVQPKSVMICRLENIKELKGE